MISASFPTRPKLDDPWRRLAWLTPSALLLWATLLIGFTFLLEDTGRPPEPLVRLDARLIDLPAPAPAGLQGGTEPAQPVAAAPPAPQPEPHVETKKETVPIAVKKRKPAPPIVYDARGPRTAPAAETEGITGSQSSAAAEPGAVGTAGSGRAGGLGSDSVGAHAIYAPVPKIPDDLRENVFEAVAVAHFRVTFDGSANVSLVQPTSNPRLNSMLIETFKQWRFFPAIRNGIAVDSEFDIHIPIAVQER